MSKIKKNKLIENKKTTLEHKDKNIAGKEEIVSN